MKRVGILFVCLLLTSAQVYAASVSKADPSSVVTEGNARFTVLTDRMIRLEWADSARFEDRASLAVINRNLPKVPFKVTRNGSVLTIRTSSLTLTYCPPARFDSLNLSITFDGKTWHPGDSDSGNLKGTIRTLDGCKGHGQISFYSKEFENGLLSRDGWAVIDESGRPLFQPSDSDWQNLIVENPCPDRTDWYFLAYGKDYKRALADYTLIAGKVPMPPKYTLGYWWSRYWAYTDDELLEIAGELRSHEVPADVFVIDMGWHKYWKDIAGNYRGYKSKTGALTRAKYDEFGERIEWTGYSWNRNLIRDPEDLLGKLHSMGFRTSLNLHPASGIRPIEDCYGDFRKDYLSRTSDYDGPENYVYGEGGYQFRGHPYKFGEAGKDAPIPFRLEQQAWADAYFGSVLHPLEKQGVDFWWLDWQQWSNGKYMPSLSNTYLCNYMFWQDKVRSGSTERPLIYHRWGGMGSHRYQLGFSGDCYVSWQTLKFIPYFTATASNVCYGYWGHDIGGHMLLPGNKTYTDPEMYTRWLQSGVFTPIFKTHSTESKYLERKIWTFPTHFEYMRDAIRLRYALIPYIYTAAREAFDTGICICRPLYYDHPDSEEAYDFREEYMFGPDILAVTICEPVNPESGLAPAKVWFPEGGDWYDMALHRMHEGGSTATLEYLIHQNPWFPKAGSIIPLSGEGIQNLQGLDEGLRLLVVPGGGRAEHLLYEDDGRSRDYETEFARTLITKDVSSRGLKITIGPRKGSYDGAPSHRRISIVLEGRTDAPSVVKLNGRLIQVNAHPAEKAVSDKAMVIDIPATEAGRKTVIEIR